MEPEQLYYPRSVTESVTRLFGALGLDVSDLDVNKIDAPVIEVERGNLIYVKFMSWCGELDDELGDRFALLAQRRGGAFSRTRKRSGWTQAATFPELLEDHEES